MTYGQFLLVFLLVPIVVLAVALRARIRRHHRIACGLVCLLAFVYTTPWDNYAAYKKLWTFAPEFVGAVWIGYLPLEEYLFYFAEAVFVCLALVALSQVPALAPRGPEER